MSDSDQKPDDNLEAYLDGTLSEATRAQFAREVEQDRELQAAAELQRRIDAVLVRHFQAPAPPTDVASRLRAPATLAVPRPWRRRALLTAAAAAAAAIWGVLGWQLYTPPHRRPVYDPRVPLPTIYENSVAAGFKPTWVCEDDHVFASTFFERQGQGLLLSQLPEGSRMEGLAYFGGLSGTTTTMLARVDGTPVMVFVDRLEADARQAKPARSSGLHLFRKELPGLVMYELTPFNKPRVMDYLYPADVPPRRTTSRSSEP